MSTLSTVLMHDARLQYRYGIYAAYAFVIAFYVVILTVGRGLLPEWGVGLVIYTDPAAVGFFFLGALVMPMLALAVLIMNTKRAWIGSVHRNHPLTIVVLIAILLFFAYAGYLALATGMALVA